MSMEKTKEAHAVLLKHSHNVRKRDEGDLPIHGAMVPYSECINAMDEYAAVRLDQKINTPQTADFIESVKCEMVHQQERWGDETKKYPHDFALVLGYLQGKLIKSIYDCDREKFIHHVITTAAVAGVIHKYLTEESNTRKYFEPYNTIKQ